MERIPRFRRRWVAPSGFGATLGNARLRAFNPTPIPSLRTLIVDDDRLARKFLRLLLAAHPDVVVVGEAASVVEAAAMAAQEQPELILLDVQMPRATGFDLLPLLSPPAPAIVFTTAHDTYAVRAFEVGAADYLVKPVSPERLAAALARVREGFEPAVPSRVPDDTLILRAGDRVRRVPLTEIAAVVAQGHYTCVYLAAEPAMFIPRGIAGWTAQLPSPDFLRADRSLIVNLSRVRALDVLSRDVAQLTLAAVGVPLTLGRAASNRLRAAIGRRAISPSWRKSRQPRMNTIAGAKTGDA